MEACLKHELNQWMLRNEVLWCQKSRETWLREGDRSSKYFHLSTVIRRRCNSIDVIKSNAGGWITDKKSIREHFLLKFTELFKEETMDFRANLNNLIPPSITANDNEVCAQFLLLLKSKRLYLICQHKKPQAQTVSPYLFTRDIGMLWEQM